MSGCFEKELLSVCFRMRSFRGQTKFKFSDEQSRPFQMGVPHPAGNAGICRNPWPRCIMDLSKTAQSWNDFEEQFVRLVMRLVNRLV